jgi:hypothetical protein
VSERVLTETAAMGERPIFLGAAQSAGTAPSGMVRKFLLTEGLRIKERQLERRYAWKRGWLWGVTSREPSVSSTGEPFIKDPLEALFPQSESIGWLSKRAVDRCQIVVDSGRVIVPLREEEEETKEVEEKNERS